VFLVKREDLAEALYKKHPSMFHSRVGADRIVSDLFDIIRKFINQGERTVKVYGFGTFTLKTVAEGKCRHPVTKERMVVPAYRLVRFSMSDGFKKEVNHDRETGFRGDRTAGCKE
jgi:nucleoid DNA-binding protein